MKKIIAISSLLLGAFLFSGCSQQTESQTQTQAIVPVVSQQSQPASQTQSTPATKKIAAQPPQTPTSAASPVTMQSLLGMWSASDGSIKTFSSNGTCAVGMGDGPQSYMLSSSPDSNGRYTLQVTRPFDAFTLFVKDEGGNKMSVYDEKGGLLWTMTRK